MKNMKGLSRVALKATTSVSNSCKFRAYDAQVFSGCCSIAFGKTHVTTKLIKAVSGFLRFWFESNL